MELMELLQSVLTDPNGTYDQLNLITDQAKPLVTGIASKAVDYYSEFVDNSDRLCLAKATLMMKRYRAYLEVGFDEDQAMRLLLNEGDHWKQVASAVNNVRPTVNQ